jgi:hypothetical protein
MTRQKFIGKITVGSTSSAFGVVFKNRLSMARSLAYSNGAWDDCFIELSREIVSHFFDNLAG